MPNNCWWPCCQGVGVARLDTHTGQIMWYRKWGFSYPGNIQIGANVQSIVSDGSYVYAGGSRRSDRANLNEGTPFSVRKYDDGGELIWASDVGAYVMQMICTPYGLLVGHGPSMDVNTPLTIQAIDGPAPSSALNLWWLLDEGVRGTGVFNADTATNDSVLAWITQGYYTRDRVRISGGPTIYDGYTFEFDSFLGGDNGLRPLPQAPLTYGRKAYTGDIANLTLLDYSDGSIIWRRYVSPTTGNTHIASVGNTQRQVMLYAPCGLANFNGGFVVSHYPYGVGATGSVGLGSEVAVARAGLWDLAFLDSSGNHTPHPLAKNPLPPGWTGYPSVLLSSSVYGTPISIDYAARSIPFTVKDVAVNSSGTLLAMLAPIVVGANSIMHLIQFDSTGNLVSLHGQQSSIYNPLWGTHYQYSVVGAAGRSPKNPISYEAETGDQLWAAGLQTLPGYLLGSSGVPVGVNSFGLMNVTGPAHLKDYVQVSEEVKNSAFFGLYDFCTLSGLSDDSSLSESSSKSSSSLSASSSSSHQPDESSASSSQSSSSESRTSSSSSSSGTSSDSIFSSLSSSSSSSSSGHSSSSSITSSQSSSSLTSSNSSSGSSASISLSSLSSFSGGYPFAPYYLLAVRNPNLPGPVLALHRGIDRNCEQSLVWEVVPYVHDVFRDNRASGDLHAFSVCVMHNEIYVGGGMEYV